MYPIQSFFSQYLISFHDHGLGFSFLCFHFMIWMQIVQLCYSSIQPYHLLFTRLNLVFHGCPCLSPKYFQLLLMDLVFFWPFNFCIVDIRASLSLSFPNVPTFPKSLLWASVLKILYSAILWATSLWFSIVYLWLLLSKSKKARKTKRDGGREGRREEGGREIFPFKRNGAEKGECTVCCSRWLDWLIISMSIALKFEFFLWAEPQCNILQSSDGL